MGASMIRRGRICRTPAQAQSGFSLLEVVISMAILSVGLVSLLGVFGLAMASTQTSQQDLIAKQLANEALESIVTARNTTQIAWDDIQNTGSTCADGSSGCGIFANTPVAAEIFSIPCRTISVMSWSLSEVIAKSALRACISHASVSTLAKVRASIPSIEPLTSVSGRAGSTSMTPGRE